MIDNDIQLLREFKWLKTTLILTSIILISFWAYFFLVEIHNPKISDSYIAHELSFPFPDIFWIVALLLLALRWLKQNDIKGLVAIICAGSALVFLALIDISYNTTQGVYMQSVGDFILNITINALSLFYGLKLISVGYILFNKITNRTI